MAYLENGHKMCVFVCNVYVYNEYNNFCVSIHYSYGEWYVGSGTAEGNERTEKAAFFSVDSGSEPESGISLNVSILVSVLN